MANPKLTIEFMPNGSSGVKFSAITGITPGRLDRVNLQARRELKRLCIVAGEVSRKKKEQDDADRAFEAQAEAEAKAKAKSDAETEADEKEDEEEEELASHS